MLLAVNGGRGTGVALCDVDRDRVRMGGVFFVARVNIVGGL